MLQNTPARQTKSKSKTASTTSGAPDAYEFDETDDFISGRSSLPTSFSPYGAQKISRNAPFTKTVPKKKGKTTNQQKGKRAKQDNLSKSVTKKLRVSRKVKEDEKKTSTPLLVESANSASKAAQKVSPGKLRRSPRVILPKLELDFSVTPILPVFTPVSPKQRAKGVHDASYVAASKSQVTPFLPADQSDRQKTRRQAVLTRHSQSSFSLALHDSASVSQPKGTLAVSTVTEKKDSKRKRSKSNSTRSVETDGNAPAKRQKADHPKTKQDPQSSKQQRQASKKLSKCPKQPKKSSQKEAYSKQTPVPYSRDSLGKKSSKQRNPVTSTQVSHQGAELTGLWEQGKEKMCCVVTPYLHDSGISMGNGTSTSRMTDSSMPSLPGFMEEEPLQCELQDFSSSPLSQPKTAHSFEPGNFENESKSTWCNCLQVNS